MAANLKEVSDQLIETQKVSFTGINAEYPGMEELSLGQPVVFRISGYVRKEGTEFLEASEEDGEPTTRNFKTIKVTAVKRLKS
jgi:hypothetical protein